MRVLLADDDADIVDITAYALRRHGFMVSVAADGSQALQMWRASSPDVILLDARMPKINGFDVLRTIRQESDTPVIMVTARNDEEDIIRGLDLGADDYVVKPFSPRQLAARIRSATRRLRLSTPEAITELHVADMTLDVESHEVTRDGTTIRMTPIEFRILYTLMLNAGRVVASSRLIENTWGFDGGDTNMLKTHICHVRKKLGRAPGTSGYIKGMTGVGYIMER
jgi:DNA-binding response OmpR family regulator